MISLLLRIEGGEQSKPLFFTKMFDRRYIFTWPGTYNRAPDDRASQVLMGQKSKQSYTGSFRNVQRSNKIIFFCVSFNNITTKITSMSTSYIRPDKRKKVDTILMPESDPHDHPVSYIYISMTQNNAVINIFRNSHAEQIVSG